MLVKRYQFYGPRGIEWTPWFPCKSVDKEPWQLKSSGLKNEYKKVRTLKK